MGISDEVVVAVVFGKLLLYGCFWKFVVWCVWKVVEVLGVVKFGLIVGVFNVCRLICCLLVYLLFTGDLLFVLLNCDESVKFVVGVGI